MPGSDTARLLPVPCSALGRGTGGLRATARATGERRLRGQGVRYEEPGRTGFLGERGASWYWQAQAQGDRTRTHTGVDAPADGIRVQRVDVLVSRTANQVIGAVASDVSNPGAGTVEPGQFNRLREGAGDPGTKPARQSQALSRRERERGRNRERGAWQAAHPHSRTWECVSSHGKRDFAGAVQVRVLRCRGYQG